MRHGEHYDYCWDWWTTQFVYSFCPGIYICYLSRTRHEQVHAQSSIVDDTWTGPRYLCTRRFFFKNETDYRLDWLFCCSILWTHYRYAFEYRRTPNARVENSDFGHIEFRLCFRF